MASEKESKSSSSTHDRAWKTSIPPTKEYPESKGSLQRGTGPRDKKNNK